MKWCRCSECNHKMFMYAPEEIQGEGRINIKCSSCKKIIDVFFKNGEMICHESKA